MALSLTIILSLMLSTVESARIHAIMSFEKESAQLALESVLAEYNIPLYERYGLFAVDGNRDYLTEDNIVPDHSDEFWCFVDWGDGLNSQAASLAILIYSIRYGIRLAQIMNDEERISFLKKNEDELKKSAMEHFWDEEQQMFVSGAERQISWATQIWMILARVFPQEKNRELILRTIEVNPDIRMVTPYMYHHYIDALIRSGEKERALDEIKRYWGGMVNDGADTFWEVYNPDNKDESPYGSVMINSYCHAWSCTPTYFLRKFYND